jgi:hypothetical protein
MSECYRWSMKLRLLVMLAGLLLSLGSSSAMAEPAARVPAWGMSLDGHLALLEVAQRECYARDGMPRGLGGALSVDLPMRGNQTVLTMNLAYHHRVAHWRPTHPDARGGFSEIHRHRWETSAGFRRYLGGSTPFRSGSIWGEPARAPWLLFAGGQAVTWQPGEYLLPAPALVLGAGLDLGRPELFLRAGFGLNANLLPGSVGVHSDCFGGCAPCYADYLVTPGGLQAWVSVTLVVDGDVLADVLVPD